MLKLLTLWGITSHNGSLDDKLIHNDIELLKFWVNLRIYQRMNETFSDSNSFIWQLLSPYNNNKTKFFPFEIAQLFLQSCFFGQSQVSLKFKVKNHKNISTFRLFTQRGHNWLQYRIVSISFWHFKFIIYLNL